MWCLKRNIQIAAQHSTPARCPESRKNDRQVRLATESGLVQQDHKTVRSNKSGPICLTSDRTVSRLFQLVVRFLCSGNRCLPAGLVSDQGVHQPILGLDRQSPVQGPKRLCPDCSSGTSLEDTALGSTTPTDVNISSMPD